MQVDWLTLFIQWSYIERYYYVKGHDVFWLDDIEWIEGYNETRDDNKTRKISK